MKIFICILFFISIFGHSCEIIFPKNIIIIQEESYQGSIDFLDNSSCDKDTVQKIKKRILNSAGHVQAKNITNKLNITTNNELIQIISLKKLIGKILGDDLKKYKLRKALTNKTLLFYSSPDDLKIKKTQSQNNQKAYYLTVKNHHLLVQFNKTKNIPVYVSTKFISKLSGELKPQYFKKIFVQESNPEQFFSDFENIKYYKTLKNLEAGSILKKTDLTEQYLVKNGDIVDVYANSKTLQIKSKALARSNGKIGSSITLENIKSKKKFNAKISGFKTVEVQL